jgi:hypothetical protein
LEGAAAPAPSKADERWRVELSVRGGG